MLPASYRMRSGSDFEAAVRRGRRAGTPRVVVHVVRTGPAGSIDPPTPGTRCPRVGFVVSKAVGGSVVRHRVARRLRESVRPLLAALPTDALVVVRAQPAAAASSFEQLRRDVSRLLGRLGLVPAAAPTTSAAPAEPTTTTTTGRTS